MSWLFGMNKGQSVPDFPPQFPLPPPDGGGDDGKKGSDSQGQLDKSKMEAYRFDSAALERAAKAAKDLEKSRMLRLLHLCRCHIICERVEYE